MRAEHLKNPERENLLKRRFVVRDEFILREIAGETTIIPVGSESKISNAILMPNGSATFLWKTFQTPCSIGSAIEQLTQEYDVADETAVNAVLRFVDELMQYQILKEETEK